MAYRLLVIRTFETQEKLHMKHLRPMLAVAIVMLAMAMPSISAAQYHEERLDQFLNDVPT